MPFNHRLPLAVPADIWHLPSKPFWHFEGLKRLRQTLHFHDQMGAGDSNAWRSWRTVVPRLTSSPIGSTRQWRESPAQGTSAVLGCHPTRIQAANIMRCSPGLNTTARQAPTQSRKVRQWA